MAKHKLDYWRRNAKTEQARDNRTQWGATVTWGLLFLAFGMLLFAIVSTAFNHRVTHLNLRKEYQQLTLKYDSLYATKLHADKKIDNLSGRLKAIQDLEQPKK